MLSDCGFFKFLVFVFLTFESFLYYFALLLGFKSSTLSDQILKNCQLICCNVDLLRVISHYFCLVK